MEKLVDEARSARLPVKGDVIKAFGLKAKTAILASDGTAEDARSKVEAFVAGDTRHRNYIIRHKLKSVRLHGEGDGVDEEAAAEGMKAVRTACLDYLLGNIFNVDETGVQDRVYLRDTYIQLGKENSKTVRGTKGMTAKDRVSAYMCTNATGEAKVPMAIIGKSKNPRCFRNRPPPVKYFSQANAWSDSTTFKTWFHEVFLPFILRHTCEPVLLIMDGCASHGELVDPRGQVETITYLPNVTSRYQPMDKGIISAVKRGYRNTLPQLRVDTMSIAPTLREQAKARKMPSGTKGLAEGHLPHLLDTADILNQS